MPLPSDPRLLLHNRVTQAILYLREYWIIADQMQTLITGGTLTGLVLAEKLNAATQIRTSLAGAIGGVGNADVRADIASQFNLTSINADINTANIASTAMLKAMSDLLAVVAAGGQIVNANDTSGRVDTIITSPDSDLLLASITALKVEIVSPN